jgi:predicted nuclease of predicted toxin-antitoxin system
MRFLLDEDLPPEIARIARGLQLDTVSVHELGRAGLSDEDQLSFAAGERRTLVTRNRDDFIALTRAFYATGRTHYGVLIVPRSLPNSRLGAVANALEAWQQRYEGGSPGCGFLAFL